MAKEQSGLSQHKRMAMGKGFAKGGSVPAPGGKPLKTGIPDSPITKSKMGNGIPGMKKGGSC